MAVSNSGFCTLHDRIPYNPPLWVTDRISAEVIPETRIRLFNGPTPIHNFNVPGLESSGLISYIKRDDLTSFDMSGNKVRKLEFLMAEALGAEVPHDSVITIGGIQSNHARATAVACRQLGLIPYLILRTDEKPEQVEFVGNLLFNRYTIAGMR
jgi:D-cysteine desulfhydrase